MNYFNYFSTLPYDVAANIIAFTENTEKPTLIAISSDHYKLYSLCKSNEIPTTRKITGERYTKAAHSIGKDGIFNKRFRSSYIPNEKFHVKFSFNEISPKAFLAVSENLKYVESLELEKVNVSDNYISKALLNIRDRHFKSLSFKHVTGHPGSVFVFDADILILDNVYCYSEFLYRDIDTVHIENFHTVDFNTLRSVNVNTMYLKNIGHVTGFELGYKPFNISEIVFENCYIGNEDSLMFSDFQGLKKITIHRNSRLSNNLSHLIGIEIIRDSKN
jgi:hypothetical protein